MGNTWMPEERANECVAARTGQHHDRKAFHRLQHLLFQLASDVAHE